MTPQRMALMNIWVRTHCTTCKNNLDKGTEHINCQAAYEVEKDVGIACIHYEREAGDTDGKSD